MTKLASRSLGTVVPTSAQAAWMQRAIRRVESNSVPSQSKTIRSKRRAWHGGGLGRDQAGACKKPRRPPAAARRARAPRRWPDATKRSRAGVQEHPFEAHARHRRGRAPASCSSAKSPYFGSPTIGVAGVRKVDADLVRAAGLDRDVEQAEGLEAARDHADQRDRAPAVGVVGVDGAHPPRAVGVEILVQGDVDHLELVGPGAGDQRRVGLADRALGSRRAQVVLQRDQRRALLGDQEQARGFLVEPVHELEELGRRAGPGAAAR